VGVGLGFTEPTANPHLVGATTDRALERVGRLADGCFLSASVQPDDEFQRIVSLVRNVAETAGRDPSAIGFEARVLVGGSSDNDIIEAGKAVESWRGLERPTSGLKRDTPNFVTLTTSTR